MKETPNPFFNLKKIMMLNLNYFFQALKVLLTSKPKKGMMLLELQEILKELSKFHMLRVKLTFFFKGNQPCMTNICYISHTPNQGYLDILEFVHP